LPLEERTVKKPQGNPAGCFCQAAHEPETLFLLISRQTHHRDSATDFEALSVARNALSLFKHHAFTTTTSGESMLAEQRGA
jgi:hypothetical protein